MMNVFKIIPVVLVIFLGLTDPAAHAQTDTLARQDTTVTGIPVQDNTGRVEIVEVDTASADTTSGLEQLEEAGDDTLSEIENLISVGGILAIVIAFVLTYFLNRFVILVLDNLSERFTSYRLGIKRLVPVVRLVIWAFAIYIIIVGIIAPPLSTIITVLASVGIAVGFAAQDILKNIFGGFIIIMDRPFQVGDKIQVSEHYGEVLTIGLRSSRIVTPDDSVVTIPNNELMNKAVSNANSSALDCQVVAEIFLPMDIDVDAVKRIAYRAALSSRYVYLKKPISVITLNEMSARSFVVKLRVKAYVFDIRYEFPFKSDMTELILNELKDRGFLSQQEISDQQQE